MTREEIEKKLMDLGFVRENGQLHREWRQKMSVREYDVFRPSTGELIHYLVVDPLYGGILTDNWKEECEELVKLAAELSYVTTTKVALTKLQKDILARLDEVEYVHTRGYAPSYKLDGKNVDTTVSALIRKGVIRGQRTLELNT